MVTYDDIRRITNDLPGAIESEDRFGFSVLVKGKYKGFLWLWNERIHPKKPKVLNPNVVAIVVRHITEKQILLGTNNPAYFDEPHYNGFAAILVRLELADIEEIGPMIIEAWRTKAPPDLLKQYDSQVD